MTCKLSKLTDLSLLKYGLNFLQLRPIESVSHHLYNYAGSLLKFLVLCAVVFCIFGPYRICQPLNGYSVHIYFVVISFQLESAEDAKLSHILTKQRYHQQQLQQQQPQWNIPAKSPPQGMPAKF